MKEQLLVLSQSHPDLNALIERNTAILAQARFSIVEYKTDLKLNPPIYPFEYTGNLHRNGYLYLNTTCFDSLAYPLSHWKKNVGIPYPKQLKGTMDFLGNIHLEVSELGYTIFFAKRALIFALTNNSEGMLTFEVQKLEIQTNRNEYSTHFLGDPFGKNETLRHEFMANCEKMKRFLST